MCFKVRLVLLGTYMGRLGLGLLLIILAAMLRVNPLTPPFAFDLMTIPAPHSDLPWAGLRNLGWSSAGSTWLIYRSYREKLRLLDLLLADSSVGVVGIAVL